MAEESEWPTEIRLHKDRRTLTITFESGTSHALPAELLRVYSPSAEVQGHSPEQRKTVPGMADITILGLQPVGRYAVRITFADGHNTGLFTWTYLRKLGEIGAPQRLPLVAELAEKGLSRGP